MDMGKFRAPTLRTVAVTAPYMHDGSIVTLEDVIRFYEAGGRETTSGPHRGDGRQNPLKSPLVSGFSLNDAERSDLLEFLGSLTDEGFLSNPDFARPSEER
jgi:cytochrome c peroxidase